MKRALLIGGLVGAAIVVPPVLNDSVVHAWGNGHICWEGTTYEFANEQTYYYFLHSHSGAKEGDCTPPPTYPTTTTTQAPETTTTLPSIPDVTVDCGFISVSGDFQQGEVTFNGGVATLVGASPLEVHIGEDVNGGSVNAYVRAGDREEQYVIVTNCLEDTVPPTTLIDIVEPTPPANPPQKSTDAPLSTVTLPLEPETTPVVTKPDVTTVPPVGTNSVPPPPSISDTLPKTGDTKLFSSIVLGISVLGCGIALVMAARRPGSN